MFLGAGSAATGIGDLMVTAFEAEGLSNKEARERLSFIDRHGLIVASREKLAPHSQPYAHDREPLGICRSNPRDQAACIDWRDRRTGYFQSGSDRSHVCCE